MGERSRVMERREKERREREGEDGSGMTAFWNVYVLAYFWQRVSMFLGDSLRIEG